MSEQNRSTELTEITEIDIGDLDMPMFTKEDGTPDESIVPLPPLTPPATNGEG